ncbi:MAG TPA: flagellar biosynthetic protein FliO [Gemmata sp.]
MKRPGTSGTGDAGTVTDTYREGTMPNANTKKPVRIPPALLGAGVLVVLLGFGLPALVSPSAPQPAPPAPQAPQAAAETFGPRATAPAPLQQTPGSVGLALLRLVASLTVVCGGCVLVVRWMSKKQTDPPNPSMSVIASLKVGRCAVHLVRAGDRRMLIGTDVSGVKALVELPGPDPASAPDAIPDALPVGATGPAEQDA